MTRLFGMLLGLFATIQTTFAQTADYDVAIYGATPSGIAAAIAAADDGCKVLLVEPTDRIGGLVTNGLSHTDFHSLESLTGAFWDFAQRVESYYKATYGEGSTQHLASFHGTFGEPKINLMVFETMLAEHPSIVIEKKTLLRGVEMGSGKRESSRHIAVLMLGGRNLKADIIRANVFIDASYEGDLMALTTLNWTTGRESKKQFGEPLAPENPDDQLQAYNFRWIMTQDEDNRVLPQQPKGYQRENFIDVVKHLESGGIQKIFGYPSKCIFKAQTPPLPNGKYDINDVSRGQVRLSLPGKNKAWPVADLRTREEIHQEHLNDQLGLLYFLQNDDAVPSKFRDEARSWGFCRDEFKDNGHIPEQIYVREARRMVGVHTYKEQDSDAVPGDARAVFHPTSIAMGDYGNNCHGTAHEGGRFDGKHVGEFYKKVPPYQIPYGVLLPRDVDNLLVCGAVSSSHVGFCALRLEPIWMSLGQAAGHAAALADQNKEPVQDVDVVKLQRRLHSANSATIYVSDIRPGHPDFQAVQWWGSLGGFHGIEPTPADPRGKTLHGQYSEAAPGHEAKLDEPLNDDLRNRWITIANNAKIAIPETTQTRGDFIRSAFQQ